MRHFPVHVCADDDPVALHFPEALGQHFFRRLREESVQFAGPRWPFLKPTKNANLPFSLNQRQRKSDRSLFLSRKLAAFRNWMVCGSRRKETVQFTAHCGCRDMPGAVFRPIEIGNRHPCHIAPPLLDIGGLAHALLGVIPPRRVPYLLKAPPTAVWGRKIGIVFIAAANSSPILLDNWW
jgi:hypothetical protein